MGIRPCIHSLDRSGKLQHEGDFSARIENIFRLPYGKATK
jgi:hypothetical protein